jgi:hypothetical protein
VLHWVKRYLIELVDLPRIFNETASIETIREVVRLPTDYGYGMQFQLEDGSSGVLGLYFKIHNYFLDVAVSWGIVGALVQFALLLLTVRFALNLRPAAVALLIVHIYLLAWFAYEFLLAPLWVFWALALVPVSKMQEVDSVAK